MRKKMMPIPLATSAALLFLLGSGGARAEVPDQLDRPVVPSPRALHLIQMGVTRAGKRLVSVGERGTILLSDDNGRTWRQAKAPVSLTLTSVCFPSEKLGWAVGHSGVILHTSDGGESWAKQADGKQAAQAMLDDAKATARPGDAASERQLADAERFVKDGPDKPFLDVWFSDEQNGVAVGAYGLLFGTADGGKTWQSWQTRVQNPKEHHFYSARRFGGDWFLAGEQGALFRSADGGKSFQEIKTPYAGTYFGFLADGKRNWLAFGLRGNAYWSGDGGARWQKVDTGMPASLTGGTALSDGSVVLVDEAGRVLRSTDGGRTFQPLPVAQPAPFTGVAESGDGALVTSGARGVTRVARIANAQPGATSKEVKP